jgi:hypothetical protein
MGSPAFCPRPGSGTDRGDVSGAGVTRPGSDAMFRAITGNDGDRKGTMKRIAMIVLTAGLAAGCAYMAPPPDYEAPPTEEDFRYLGGDALDPYFLTTWRSCTQFKSTSTCKDEIYGGDGDYM